MRLTYLISLRFTLNLMVAAASVPAAGQFNQLTQQEEAAGWKLLFDGKTTQGWRSFKKQSFPDKGWVVENGWLHCLGKGGGNKGGGDIITDAEFDNFELEWEWKLAVAANSGLKYFVLETRNEALGHEYQMIDDERAVGIDKGNRKQLTASFYAVMEPTCPPVKPPGQINSSRILVKGDHVEHWLNGVKVLEYECGSEVVRAAIAASKFRDKAGFGNSARGHLLLQDHNCEVWFRNVKIRELPVAR
ncbi:MAG TPA: DUF1080 domain-containing protein [Verrucomicrobiota bacterium]|nr:DUF1080 domain-containing protein [Verrucomicrobiota bacterium]HQL78217.1 DUF1080 domain-containing protein [Verrucomicrobiota bacterium]